MQTEYRLGNNKKHPQLVSDTGPGKGMRYDEVTVAPSQRLMK